MMLCWLFGLLLLGPITSLSRVSPGVVNPPLLTEDCSSISDMTGTKGWTVINLSSPLGVNTWFPGYAGPGAFPGVSNGAYIAVDYKSGIGASNLNNYLISPQFVLAANTKLRFWSRTVDLRKYADRLRVRLSTNGASTNVADFSTVLLTINEQLEVNGFPNTWTQYTLDLPGTAAGARIAFHYDVTDGGTEGNNSDYVGLDEIQVYVEEPAVREVRATFSATSTDHVAAASTFKFKLDNGQYTAFAAGNGFTTGVLATGTHTVSVIEKNAAGVEGMEQSHTWTIGKDEHLH